MTGTLELREWLSVLRRRPPQITEKDNQIEELRDAAGRTRLGSLSCSSEAEGRVGGGAGAQAADRRPRIELADARRDAAAAARQEADQLDRMLMYGRRMLRHVRPLIQPLRKASTQASRLNRASFGAGRYAARAVRPIFRGVSTSPTSTGGSRRSCTRTLIFPLRLTPLDRVLSLGPGARERGRHPRGAGTGATAVP